MLGAEGNMQRRNLLGLATVVVEVALTIVGQLVGSRNPIILILAFPTLILILLYLAVVYGQSRRR